MRNFFLRKTILLFCSVLLFCFANPAWAVTAKIETNGEDISNINIEIGEELSFRNVGTYWCVDIKWMVKHADDNSWKTIDKGLGDHNSEIRFTRPGVHEIKCKSKDICWPYSRNGSDVVSVNVETGNQYPVVLVHGYIGWGRDEVSGYYYWGGHSGDIEKQLNDLGFDVYTASVGPISSAWDRACELYAQLAGGTRVRGDIDRNLVENRDDYIVDGEGYLARYNKDGEVETLYFVDYGAEHAGIFSDKLTVAGYPESSHRRFANPQLTKPMQNTNGETFTEKYNFPNDPVHFVVHSFGGQTVKVLMGLLKNGSKNGYEGDADYPASPLFVKTVPERTDFVRSVTTIATTHNGSNITSWGDDLFSVIDDFLFDLANVATSDDTAMLVGDLYNFDFGQFPFPIDSNLLNCEAIGCQSQTYLDDGRLRPDLRPAIEDWGLWDNSPCGTIELNADYPTRDFADETYFFTYNCEQSFRSAGGAIGVEGNWYYESPARWLFWNKTLSTYHGGISASMCPLFRLLSDSMGSSAYTTGLSIALKSLSQLSNDPAQPNYVPETAVDQLIEAVESKPGLLDVVNDYLFHSNNLSEGWQFADEQQLRAKIEETIDSEYHAYISIISKYGAFYMGLSEEWREFDGIANTYSSIMPWTDSLVDGTGFKDADPKKPIPNPDLSPQTGKWLYLDKLHVDHFDVVGGHDLFEIGQETIKGENEQGMPVGVFYNEHLVRLWQLPQF